MTELRSTPDRTLDDLICDLEAIAAFMNRIGDETALYVEEAVDALRGVATLRSALEPFAEASKGLDPETDDHDNIWEMPAAMSIEAGHLRAAEKALNNV